MVSAAFISQIVGEAAKLTGLGSEESQMLMYIPQDISFDYKGLLFAGILIELWVLQWMLQCHFPQPCSRSGMLTLK